MTREQALNYLASSGMTDEQIAEIVTAIERTETHACDYGKKETHGDVIYRQAAISLFDRDHAGKYWGRINNDILHEIWRDLKSLPSAEPERTPMIDLWRS